MSIKWYYLRLTSKEQSDAIEIGRAVPAGTIIWGGTCAPGEYIQGISDGKTNTVVHNKFLCECELKNAYGLYKAWVHKIFLKED